MDYFTICSDRIHLPCSAGEGDGDGDAERRKRKERLNFCRDADDREAAMKKR